MTERLFIFVGALSSKTLAVLVTGASAVLSTALGQIMTNNAVGAALAGTIGTGLAAVVLVIPRIMEQRRKSRESASQLQKDSIALLVNAHDRDLAFYKAKIAALELTIALHIKAKHKAVGEWDAAKTAYQILHSQLRGQKIEPAISITVSGYDEIVGETDDKIEAITSARVNETSNGGNPAAPE